MRTTYRVLGYLIGLEVAIQAAMIVYAVAGLSNWVDGGGVLDKAAMESDQSAFSEEVGFMIHGINGQMLIPALALAMLIVSFFARVPRGPAWAGTVLGLVIIQVGLGLFSTDLPALGLLHGLNALALFTVAVVAATKARTARPAPIEVAPQAEQAGV